MSVSGVASFAEFRRAISLSNFEISLSDFEIAQRNSAKNVAAFPINPFKEIYREGEFLLGHGQLASAFGLGVAVSSQCPRPG